MYRRWWIPPISSSWAHIVYIVYNMRGDTGIGLCMLIPAQICLLWQRSSTLSHCLPKVYLQKQKHQKRSVQQRSRRNNAEMMNKAFPAIESRIIYSSLSLNAQGSDYEVENEVLLVFKGETRKHMMIHRNPRNLPNSDHQPTMTNSRSVKKGTERSPPK